MRKKWSAPRLINILNLPIPVSSFIFAFSEPTKSIFFIFILISCGGGGGGSDSTAPTPPPDPASVDGIWHGTFTETGSGTFSVDVLIYGDEIIAISDDAGVIYKGSIEVNGNSLTAAVNDYEIGGGLFATTSLSGTFTEQNRITGTFATSYETDGTLSLTFDPIYNQPSSLEQLEGTWTYSEIGYSATYSIGSAGSISGSDSDGCVVTGTVTILDAEVNLYAVDAAVSECGDLDGSYSGLATLSDEDTLTYCVSSSEFITLYSLTRQ